MIKGGGTINNQISEAYNGAINQIGNTGKMGNIKNGSFYQSKYISNGGSSLPPNMN